MRPVRGFTLVETLVLVVVVGVMTAILVPRLRVSASVQLRQGTQRLRGDLELARSRALAATSAVRLRFDTTGHTITGFRDHDRDGVIAETTVETDSLAGFRARPLAEGLRFGRPAGVPLLGADTSRAMVTFAGARLAFDPRGLTAPLGASGVVYVRHVRDTTAAAAVTVTAAGAMRVWTWSGGAWR